MLAICRYQPCPEFPLIHGQITGHFSGLAVDAEGELLTVPLGIQDPHRQWAVRAAVTEKNCVIGVLLERRISEESLNIWTC